MKTNLTVFGILILCLIDLHAVDDVQSGIFPHSGLTDNSVRDPDLSMAWSLFFDESGETPIFNLPENHPTEIYRLSILRSFHRPIVIRIEIKPDGKKTSRIYKGAHWFNPEEHQKAEIETAQLAETNLIESTFRDLDFEAYPPESYMKYICTSDGSTWLIESKTKAGYHIIFRGSPTDPVILGIGDAFFETVDFKPIPIY